MEHRTPKHRAPEHQRNRSDVTSKKRNTFGWSLKKESHSFSALFLCSFSRLFLFSGTRCSIHRGFYSQRQNLHASISPAQRCRQTVGNEWHIPMGKPQYKVTKRIVHRHNVMMNKGQLQPYTHSWFTMLKKQIMRGIMCVIALGKEKALRTKRK